MGGRHIIPESSKLTLVSVIKKASMHFLFWFLSVCFWKGVSLSPRLEYSGKISAYCSLCLPGSSSSSVSTSLESGITGTCHHTRLIFVFLVELGFHHVDQTCLELLTSGDSPTSASQSTGITGMSQCSQPKMVHFTSCIFCHNLKNSLKTRKINHAQKI